MATLSVMVFADAKEVLFDVPTQVEQVTIGAGSLQSGAIAGSKSEIRYARLFADADCYVLWGANPTALDFSTSMPLGAENPEVIGIKAGHKVAVIQR